MRIASWNINSLRKRQDRLFAWVETERPDVVCLQETKCTDEQFPLLALQAAGYHAVYHGEKSYNGVAILSKSKPLEVRASLCDEIVDPQARVISAKIDNLVVYSIYAPNGQAVGSPAYEYKLNWYARLRDCLAQEASDSLIVCGDFNVAPEDVDVFDPALWRGAIMCSDGERSAFRVLCEIGLRDTLRLHHKEGGLFSWWDYRMLSFPKNRGLRIDAILASGALAKKCSAAGIDREMRKGKEASDHAPVWAELICESKAGTTSRFAAAEAAHDLGWRMPFLPALDRALARNHRRRSRVRHVSGSRRPLPGNHARGISASSRLHRHSWQCFFGGGSGLSLFTMSIFEKMAGLELRSCSGLRANF
jgi:exodeoxyribonuclease-3